MVLQKTEICFLVIISTLTIGFHLYHFGLPPFWPDELPFVWMNQALLNPPNSDLHNYAFNFGVYLGDFPINYAPYNAALSSYFSIPFIYFLGLNITGVRSYQILTTVLIVILMYFAGKEIFSKRVGMISSSLLATFPIFVFYSRQSITYDWILLSFVLLIIIFGLRYLKTMKNTYLFFSIFLIGIGIWDYLWFLWYVVGFIVTAPIWLKVLNSKINNSIINSKIESSKHVVRLVDKKIKILTISIFALIAGFTPIIISTLFTKEGSVIQFILKTLGIGGTTTYLVHSNSNIIGNMILRAHDFLSILENPRIGLIISGAQTKGWNEISYVYLILFFLSVGVSITYIIYKKPHSKKIACLLIIILAIYFTSIFTVTVFTVLQYANILPIIFLIIGLGIEIIITNERLNRSFSILRKKNSITYIAIGIIISIISIHSPFLVKGFEAIENSPLAFTHIVYEDVETYMKEHELKFVSFDFFTDKTVPFYTKDDLVPAYKIPYGTIPYFGFDNKTKESIGKLEYHNLLSSKYLFVVYVYPKISECDENYVVGSDQSNYCAQFYFIESAAIRNNLEYKIKDFNLPDGTPFFRTYQFVE